MVGIKSNLKQKWHVVRWLDITCGLWTSGEGSSYQHLFLHTSPKQKPASNDKFLLMSMEQFSDKGRCGCKVFIPSDPCKWSDFCQLHCSPQNKTWAVLNWMVEAAFLAIVLLCTKISWQQLQNGGTGLFYVKYEKQNTEVNYVIFVLNLCCWL